MGHGFKGNQCGGRILGAFHVPEGCLLGKLYYKLPEIRRGHSIFRGKTLTQQQGQRVLRGEGSDPVFCAPGKYAYAL